MISRARIQPYCSFTDYFILLDSSCIFEVLLLTFVFAVQRVYADALTCDDRGLATSFFPEASPL